ncbi:MAG TPA: esterase [Planctomycetota bacterium]|nr:esterase [Planctomycetota bacterium]
MIDLLLLAALAGDPERVEWTVDGTMREALVAVGSAENPPLVFAFHGHGGTMCHSARSFALEKQWPEAVVVYPQGLPTPGRLSDPEGRKPGWQHGIGEQGDRDLKFFDAMLATIKQKHRIDPKRVYATGHSNGGQFSYLLAGARREALAAIAPSGAAGGGFVKEPIPLFHIAGENDPLVRYAAQKRSIETVRALNGCDAAGQDGGAPGCTLYPSSKGAPVLVFVHDQEHAFPREAPALIVRFLKSQSRP